MSLSILYVGTLTIFLRKRCGEVTLLYHLYLMAEAPSHHLSLQLHRGEATLYLKAGDVPAYVFHCTTLLVICRALQPLWIRVANLTAFQSS